MAPKRKLSSKAPPSEGSSEKKSKAESTISSPDKTQVSETLERVLHDLHQRSSELCSFYHKEQANGLKDFTDLVMGFHKKHADGLKAHNGVSVRWQVGVTSPCSNDAYIQVAAEKVASIDDHNLKALSKSLDSVEGIFERIGLTHPFVNESLMVLVHTLVALENPKPTDNKMNDALNASIQQLFQVFGLEWISLWKLDSNLANLDSNGEQELQKFFSDLDSNGEQELQKFFSDLDMKPISKNNNDNHKAMSVSTSSPSLASSQPQQNRHNLFTTNPLESPEHTLDVVRFVHRTAKNAGKSIQGDKLFAALQPSLDFIVEELAPAFSQHPEVQEPILSLAYETLGLFTELNKQQKAKIIKSAHNLYIPSSKWKEPISNVAAFIFKLLSPTKGAEYKSPLCVLQLPQTVVASEIALSDLKHCFPLGKEMEFFQECMFSLQQCDAGILHNAVMLYTAACQEFYNALDPHSMPSEAFWILFVPSLFASIVYSLESIKMETMVLDKTTSIDQIAVFYMNENTDLVFKNLVFSFLHQPSVYMHYVNRMMLHMVWAFNRCFANAHARILHQRDADFWITTQSHWVDKYRTWKTSYEQTRDLGISLLKKSPQLAVNMMNDFMLARPDWQRDFVFWLQAGFITEKIAFSENQFIERMKVQYGIVHPKLVALLWQLHGKCAQQQRSLVSFASTYAASFSSLLPLTGKALHLIAAYAEDTHLSMFSKEWFDRVAIVKSHASKFGFYVAARLHEQCHDERLKKGYICYDDCTLVSHLSSNAVNALFSGSPRLENFLECETKCDTLRMPLSFSYSPNWISSVAPLRSPHKPSSSPPGVPSPPCQVLGMDFDPPAINFTISLPPSHTPAVTTPSPPFNGQQ